MKYGCTVGDICDAQKIIEDKWKKNNNLMLLEK